MDIRKVKKLIELLEESGIAEIEIKEGEESVRISRMPTGPAAVMQAMPQMMPQMQMPGPMQMSASASAASMAPEAAPPRPKPNEHVVTAPMVGTYYSAPSPGAK